MKVICINEEDYCPDHAKVNGPEVHVGDVRTVVAVSKFYPFPTYEFAESGPLYLYDTRNFAPHDGPCERERLETWQSERMTEADKVLQACAEMMPEVEMEPGAFERVWAGVKKNMEGIV